MTPSVRLLAAVAAAERMVADGADEEFACNSSAKSHQVTGVQVALLLAQKLIACSSARQVAGALALAERVERSKRKGSG